MKAIYLVALVIAAVGAVNWALVGLFDLNLVTSLFGEGTTLTTIVYVVVGVSGLWALVAKLLNMDE